MPDWLKKEMSRKRLSMCKLDQWAAAHHPKQSSENKADTIHDKLNPDGPKREDSTKYRMSGGLSEP
jgi:hypothetical protein